MGIKNSKKKNASGNFSTKIEILEELEEDNPIISLIMEYRELQKLLSTYIDVIPKMIGKMVGFILNLFKTLLQPVDFLFDPNLQNLPVKTELGKRYETVLLQIKVISFVLLIILRLNYGL